MRYRLLCVGKVREPYIAAAVADFRERLARYVPFEEVEVAAGRGERPAEAIGEESERIRRALDPGEIVWLLERTGTMLDSVTLSRRLTGLEGEGRSRVTFVIGGTYGVDGALRERADLLWSLGPLTFLHEWARAIVLEQLYRSAKIARNEPYHH
jgi:23S rRNA (pseudouridine1915-N3)-methyltransferase